MQTKREILKFMARNPIFFLATADDAGPHVRAVTLFRADADGIVFAVGRSKELHKQLLANPRVELCFHDRTTQEQVRVSGEAEAVPDLPLAREVAEKMPFLKASVGAKGDMGYDVFRVKHGIASAWAMPAGDVPGNYVEF